MPVDVDPDRLRRCYARVRDLLLAERTPQHCWVGELSTSALSTAAAVMALLQVRKAVAESGGRSPEAGGNPVSIDPPSSIPHPLPLNSQLSTLNSLITRGLEWLVAHQNPDGGWGDTVQSFSNISTTMLCRATLAACRSPERKTESGVGSRESWDEAGTFHTDQPSTINPHPSLSSQLSTLNSSISRAQAYIDRAGGVPALVARYGKDKTFSVPILTHCALAGLVDWKQITPLPFELACLPAKFYKTLRLPVVSYALPALIAIGQVRHHFAPARNPLTRVLRNLAIAPSLRVLERIQPSNGGFLEATPLTSFVTMSLAAMGLVDHPVVRRGVEFLVHSVRPDGSWPIDTNLSTWVTTLAVNALGDDLPEESRVPILHWLLDQQYKEVHPYTNADPGGWAWTNLPGGVPDADDTPGALLAILELTQRRRANQSRDRQGALSSAPETDAGSLSPKPVGCNDNVATSAEVHSSPVALPDGRGSDGRGSDGALRERVETAVQAGVKWLLSLQNRDGGWPTFCRGWGTLPFDRSSPDLTAHVVRALFSLVLHLRERWNLPGGASPIAQEDVAAPVFHPLPNVNRSRLCGIDFLERSQRSDGSWLPLWFGNQHAPDDVNPTYGTAKVLAAYRDCGLLDQPAAQRGMAWLRANQNPDGGWGAGPGTPSSVEETALAVEALLEDPQAMAHVGRGLEWLMQRVEAVDAPPVGAGGEGGVADSPRTILDPAPIGFYFAKLWYFERLYPLIFAVSCLRRAVHSITVQGERRGSAR